jgi:hypothetical protein
MGQALGLTFQYMNNTQRFVDTTKRPVGQAKHIPVRRLEAGVVGGL